MSDAAPHDALVEGLVARLTPVRPLPPPALRGLVWCAAVIGIGLLALPFADLAGLRARMAVTDLRLAAIGSALTAWTAAVAAFVTSVPGRSARWALLPLAPAALWVGASGLGCLRTWLVPGTTLADGADMRGCAAILIGFSLPLSVALVAMLRRACPLRPTLTAALGGLAVAAAAATLLVPVHPHDATVTDLAIHAVVVAVVIALNALAGGRLLDRGRP
jgi:hypothetical protein